MADLIFNAKKRETAGKGAARACRREGRIPFAVVCDPFYSASNMNYLRRLKKRSRPVKHTLLSTTSSMCKRGLL